jgi:hypothetical protein
MEGSRPRDPLHPEPWVFSRVVPELELFDKFTASHRKPGERWHVGKGFYNSL